MKTNIGIEIDDASRNTLAKAIDGRQTCRMVTRKEVTALVEAHWAGLVDAANAAGNVVPEQHSVAQSRFEPSPSLVVPQLCLRAMAERGYDAESQQGREFISGWMKRPAVS